MSTTDISSTSLPLLLDPEEWAEFSYHVARKMNERKLWPGYLSTKECVVLEGALESAEKWKQFIVYGADVWASSIGKDNLSALPSSSSSVKSQPADFHDDSNSNEGPSAKRENTGTYSPLKSNSSGGGTPSNGAVAGHKDPVLTIVTAFRVRASIFEHFVDVICPSHCDQCSGLQHISREFIESYTKLKRPSENALQQTEGASASQQQSIPVAPARKLEEDDDYDDDYDEPEDGNPTAKEKTQANQGDASTNYNAQKKSDKDEKGIKVEQPTEDSDRNIPIYTVFHTLEHDHIADKEQKELEDSIHKLEEATKEKELDPKESLVHQLGSINNVKNLASFIDQHRDSIDMSTHELTSLLSEIRPKRTKWSSEERIGQEELYGGLEHVINELRSMDIAHPFLQPVKKREAPNYFEIIAKPMDLGTMTKKLKSLQYDRKSEFQHDLDLIYSNCYTYNTQPDNLLRKYVTILHDRGKQLMKDVPDITIKKRSELMEVEDKLTEIGDGMDTDDDSHRGAGVHRIGDTESIKSSGYTPGFDSFGDNVFGSLHEEGRGNHQRNGSSMAMDITDSHGGNNDTFIDTDFLNDFDTEIPLSQMASEYSETLSSKIWKAWTRSSRVSNFQRGIENGEIEFANRKALIRSTENMDKFSQHSHDCIDTISTKEISIIQGSSEITDVVIGASTPSQGHEHLSNSKTHVYRPNTVSSAVSAPRAGMTTWHNHHTHGGGRGNNSSYAAQRRKNEALDKKRREALEILKKRLDLGKEYLPEYDLTSGIPNALEYPLDVNMWSDNMERNFLDTKNTLIRESFPKAKAPNMEEYEAARYPNNQMWKNIAENIEQLKQIRNIDDKIWATKMNIPIGYLNNNGANRGSGGMGRDDTEYHSLVDLEAPFEGRPDPKHPFVMNGKSAKALMQRTCSILLSHAGFEGLTNVALGCFTEFITDYILNLGKTVRSYIDKYSRTMSVEAILSHSLYENGLESIEDLEYYIHDDIGRCGAKLSDVNRKLEATYRELISEGISGGYGGDYSVMNGGSMAGTSEMGESSRADSVDGNFENTDMFMTGQLGELGEDFFGFKELGLDKEYGIDSLSHIPKRLWFGQGGKKTTTAESSDKDLLAYTPPPAWESVRSPNNHIGLLRDFIISKLEAKNGKSLNADLRPSRDGKEEADSKEMEKTSSDTPTSDRPITIKKEEESTDDKSKNETPPAPIEVPSDWEPIPEDEDLPVKSRYGSGRPKNPPPNPLTSDAASLAALGGTGSSRSKKRPSGAATKTTTSSSSAATAAGNKTVAAPSTPGPSGGGGGGDNSGDVNNNQTASKSAKKKRVS
ncbi:Transcriptional activator spt7 [Mycoemilia scoparia]|uniref:Transcriptional activator spt7 n=1 Tax=Mycoemilia scoparia TaxID=417184 RepID=A0A9W7ZW20_9FUNG|nr:Transcriptional activator spt7 [Mycoemilia scoparia]